MSESNYMVVRNIIHAFDQCFMDVNDAIYTISRLSASDSIIDYSQYKNMNTLHVHELEKIIVENITKLDYIEEVVVFFKESDLVITSKGTLDFSQFFEQSYYNKKYSAAYWEYLATSSHYLQVLPSDEYTVNGTEKRRLVQVVGSNIGSTMNIAVFINESKLLERVNRESMLKGTSITVLDQNLRVILWIGEVFDLNGVAGLYAKPAGKFSVQKDEVEYFYEKSTYNDFIYINRIPYRSTGIASTVKTNQMILIITVLVGVVITLVSSHTLYSPFSSIIKLLHTQESKTSAPGFKQVYNDIEQIKNDFESIKNRMIEVEPDIRKSIFLKMIDDITYYRNLKEQIEDYFKVFFYNSKFMMISLYLDPCADAKISDSQEVYGMPDQGAEEVIRSCTGVQFEKFVLFQMSSRQYIVMVGLKQVTKRTAVTATLKDVMEALNEKLKNQFRITASVSSMYSEAKDCKSAFNDVKLSMEYRNINMQGDIVDVEKIVFSHDEYFPVGLIEKLTTLVLSGNKKDSLDIINQIIDKNCEKNINYNRFEVIVVSIFNSITRMLSMNGYEEKEIRHMEQYFFDMLERRVDPEKIKKAFGFFIGVASKGISTKEQSKLNKQFIIQYINLHYNEDLYLENMAEVLETTPNYFSRFFKKTFENNFVDYLNKVRISHAKEYLKGTDISINEICVKVGYINSNTFTTTFRKYCGVSPTEYRRDYKI